MTHTGSVAVVGETVVDLIPDGPGGTYVPVPGGSPANVAIGLARLGVPTRLVARTGSDALARRVRARLLENGVDLSAAVATSDRTAVALVALDETGDATYDFRVERAADWGWTLDELEGALDGAVALHTGSLATALGPGAAAVLALLRRAHATATTSYDPNCRPALMGAASDVRRRLEESLPAIDVVRASLEDIDWLYPGEEPRVVAAAWLERGARLAVVTLGADGALAATRACETVHVPGIPVEVVDTIGAGDAFTSALLAALGARSLLGPGARESLAALGPDEVRAVVEPAVLAAALTCTRQGAEPPSAADLDPGTLAARL